jgi:hypothetical protein
VSSAAALIQGPVAELEFHYGVDDLDLLFVSPLSS